MKKTAGFLMLAMSVLSGCASFETPKTIRQLLEVGENEEYVYCRPEFDHEPFKKIGIEDFYGPSSLNVDLGYERNEKKLKQAGTATFKRAARQTAKMMNKCTNEHLKPNKKYYIDRMKLPYERGYYELYYNGVKTGANHSRKYIHLLSWDFISAEKHETMRRETAKFLKAAAGISPASVNAVSGTKKTNNAPAKKKIAAPKKATEADVLNFFDL